MASTSSRLHPVRARGAIAGPLGAEIGGASGFAAGYTAGATFSASDLANACDSEGWAGAREAPAFKCRDEDRALRVGKRDEGRTAREHSCHRQERTRVEFEQIRCGDGCGYLRGSECQRSRAIQLAKSFE